MREKHFLGLILTMKVEGLNGKVYRYFPVKTGAGFSIRKLHVLKNDYKYIVTSNFF